MHPWASWRRDRQLTQAYVADRLGVERLTVLRYEQGMFGHLNDELVDTLAALYKVDPDVLILEYRGFQRERRLEFAGNHLGWGLLIGYVGTLHPLIYYRNYYELSRNGLCKGLCLDYGPISNYEANKARAIPAALITASEDIKWGWTALESAVLEWRASGRSSIRV